MKKGKKKRAYLEARQSVQIWPITGYVDISIGCRDFFKNQMGVPEDTVEDIEFEAIEKLHQNRRSRFSDEVLVRFRTSRTKDLIQSFAPNLASSNGKAGLRMNVPHHLLGLFKMFETHGGRLRQRFGPGLKRSIKFEDAAMSLVMDVRLPNATEWTRLSGQDIVKITKDRAEKESLHKGAGQDNTEGERLRSILLKSPIKNPVAPHLVSSDEDEEDAVRIDLGSGTSSSAA